MVDLYCQRCRMQCGPEHFDTYHSCWKCRARLEPPYRGPCDRCGEVQEMAEGVTIAMVLAVRRQERAVHGHRWDVIATRGSGPVAVKCFHCGADSGLVRKKEAELGTV